MIREDFILTELEAIGMDIKALVTHGREQLVEEEESRQRAEEQRELGQPIAVMARRHDPNKLMPELVFLTTRLQAVMDYMMAPTDSPVSFHPHSL